MLSRGWVPLLLRWLGLVHRPSLQVEALSALTTVAQTTTEHTPLLLKVKREERNAARWCVLFLSCQKLDRTRLHPQIKESPKADQLNGTFSVTNLCLLYYFTPIFFVFSINHSSQLVCLSGSLASSTEEPTIRSRAHCCSTFNSPAVHASFDCEREGRFSSSFPQACVAVSSLVLRAAVTLQHNVIATLFRSSVFFSTCISHALLAVRKLRKLETLISTISFSKRHTFARARLCDVKICTSR